MLLKSALTIQNSVSFLVMKSWFIVLFSLQSLEPIVHGRGRKENSLDEMHFGVYDKLLYARKVKPVEGKLTIYELVCLIFMTRNRQHNFCFIYFFIFNMETSEPKIFLLNMLLVGAQWTGIVTTIAIEMLKSGMVEAVICVQRQWNNTTAFYSSIVHCLELFRNLVTLYIIF